MESFLGRKAGEELILSSWDSWPIELTVTCEIITIKYVNMEYSDYGLTLAKHEINLFFILQHKSRPDFYKDILFDMLFGGEK